MIKEEKEILSWIENRETDLRTHIRVSTDRWNSLKVRLSDQCMQKRTDYYDEVVWTFLLAIAYASGGPEGVRSLEAMLSNRPSQSDASSQIWLEALPMPPRKAEGNTNVDLAMGAISERAGSDGGIQLDSQLGDSVTFCEMKWYSDISKSVTNDQHRNQLSRIIENAVTFQRCGKFVDRVTVTLVTPKVFVESEPKSRL